MYRENLWEKHFTLQICWKNWFVSYRKNKKGSKNTLCLRTSQLRRCRKTGLIPSCSFFQTAGAPALPFVHHHHGCWPKPQGQLKSVSSCTHRDPSVCVPPEGNRKQEELLPLQRCGSSSQILPPGLDVQVGLPQTSKVLQVSSSEG